MKKGVFALLLITLLLVPILATSIVYAQVDPASSEGGAALNAQTSNIGTPQFVDVESSWGIGKFFETQYDLWLKGGNNLDEKEQVKMGEGLKWMVLFLVIVLVYSALATVEFPESSVLRVLFSVVVGFLATFMITTKELLTMLISYTGLGLTFSIFLPILILGFFTVVMARKGNVTGIYLQRILWLIYSGYMFLKTLGLYILMNSKWVTNQEVRDASGKVIKTVTGIAAPGWATSTGLVNLAAPLVQGVGTDKAKFDALLGDVIKNNDSTILMLMLVVSIGIFIIFVLSNKVVMRWLERQELEAEKESEMKKIKSSALYDKLRAEQMRGAKE